MEIGRLSQESPQYAQLRREVQEAELALRDQRERVAALRRQLPSDTPVEDQRFEEIRAGAREIVLLSELFEAPDRPLVLMHFMYGKAQQQPCPMCTMWADGYDGVVSHLRQRVNFAVLVAGDVAVFAAYARERGWRNLRLVSAAGSPLKAQLGFETADGAQRPGVSVFQRSGSGLTHFYSQSAELGADEFRGMDLLTPVWSYFDLTPEGRGDWFPRRSYGSPNEG